MRPDLTLDATILLSMCSVSIDGSYEVSAVCRIATETASVWRNYHGATTITLCYHDYTF